MSKPTMGRKGDLGRCVRRVLWVQLSLAIGVAVAVLWLSEERNALAVIYGSLLAVVNTLITARSADRSSHGAKRGSQNGEAVSLLPVYIGLANKLLVVAGGIALGIAVIGLHPMYVVLGYAVLQAGFFACRPDEYRG